MATIAETKKLVVLPTGKETISFSELSIWGNCSFKHKLKYIDKIDLEKDNEFPVFGKAIHASCENFLQTRIMDKLICIEYLKKEWIKLAFENVEDWIKIAENVLEEIPDFLNKNFPNWEYVSAEEQLYEPIKGFEHIKFKGFIDAIIKVKDENGLDVYWIIDWKTATFWSKYKKSDPLVRSQLVYYKNLWSVKKNIPIKQIKCAFILLKRKGTKGKLCELVPVSAGTLSSDRAFYSIENMVYALNNGRFLKNKINCKFCPYAETSYCP